MADFLTEFTKESKKDFPSISIYLPFPFKLDEIFPEDTKAIDPFSLDDISLASVISELENSAQYRLLSIDFFDPIQVHFAAKLLLVVGFLGATDLMGLIFLKNRFCEELSKALFRGASFPSKKVLNIVRIAKVFDRQEAQDFTKQNDGALFTKWIKDLSGSTIPFVYFVNSTKTLIKRIPIISSSIDFSINLALFQDPQKTDSSLSNPSISYDWALNAPNQIEPDPVSRMIDVPLFWNIQNNQLKTKTFLCRYNDVTDMYDVLVELDSIKRNKIFLFERKNLGKQEVSILGSTSPSLNLILPSDFKVQKIGIEKDLQMKTFSFGQVEKDPSILDKDLQSVKLIKNVVRFSVPLY